ncbi:putative GEL1 protein [Coleophoma crateriformis]|uniref:1,3-beta-glucanosyltransferase n=1 Tax=Coleophoma crateriformis TaxID=565419 RepID=A0A3D8R7J8_9HELO|nr:putative GEL1 protein [Coleophoma crateriformis]
MRQGMLMSLVAAFCALATADVTPVLAPRASTTITPVTVTGNAFYAGSSRFFIRGVDYQPGGGTGVVQDPIADAASCQRDIAQFTKLGINTIRVYAVDNSANHDTCMNALAAAGIYLVLDVNTPLYSINQANPAVSYNSVYLQSVFATIDAFANYPNTLAFISGNEVINQASNTNAAPYVKATGRDMKTYIGSRGYRTIPVGYAAADVAANQRILADYLNCGTTDERVDFYSINIYSWCDPSTFQTSGWDVMVKNYTGYGIPLFMSEFGCITNNRTFEEVGALYSTQMTDVFSGGLVYEYSQEGNGYGLVTISGNTVTEGQQFTLLQQAYQKTPNPSGTGGASTTSAASTCPASSANWLPSSDDALPAIPSAAAKFFSTGAGTGPGLQGKGSQNSGGADTGSTGTATPGSGAVTSTAKASGSKATSTGSSSSSGSSSSAASGSFPTSSSTSSSSTSSLRNSTSNGVASNPPPLQRGVLGIMALALLGVTGGFMIL